MKKYINRNIVWCDFLVDHLTKLNIDNVVVCPGSRNTPLTFAFSKNSKIKKYVIVDERTAGFFALGVAKRIGKPVAIVTTSGTAVTELYPAVTEAFQQRVPLLVLTADRPPELLHSGEAQTINQNNIFKNHIQAYYNVGLPQVSKKSYLKFSNLIQKNIEIGRNISRGPIHFNFPFKKPFEPNSYTDKVDTRILDFKNKIISEIEVIPRVEQIQPLDNLVIDLLEKNDEGIIICGGGSYPKGFTKRVIQLSEYLGYPIIADVLSPLRYGTHSKNNIVSNGVAIFKSQEFRKFITPKVIFHFGNPPLNKVMLDYFADSIATKISVNQWGDLKDPSKTVSQIIKMNPVDFIDAVISQKSKLNSDRKSNWKLKFSKLNKIAKTTKTEYLNSVEFNLEPKIAYELVKNMPDSSNLMVSNSTPPRDLDFFTNSSRKKIRIYSNRGASGIDGVISTALGIAASSKRHTFLYIGDQAFYYDINALQIAKKNLIPLTIVLVDNNGGGIFNMLPISQYKTVFDKYYTAKLDIDFEPICKGFGAEYLRVRTLNEFCEELNRIPTRAKVLHIKTDAKTSFETRKQYWSIASKKINSFLASS